MPKEFDHCQLRRDSMTIAMLFKAFEDQIALRSAWYGEDPVLTHDLKIAVEGNDNVKFRSNKFG